MSRPESTAAEISAPKVSVIIPAFNRAGLLPRSVESALGQTLRELEVIVVDDGSTDETAEVVRAIEDDRVKLVRLPENRGLAQARNAGVAAAVGRFIAFLDSDDHWVPEKLERQVAALEASARPERTLSAHSYQIDDGGPDQWWPKRGPARGEAMSEYLFVANGSLQPSTWMLARTLCLEFPFDPPLRRHQDWGLLLRLDAAGIDFLHLAEPLGTFSCAPSPDRLSDVVDAEYSQAFLDSRRELFTERAAIAFEARVVARQWYRAGKLGRASRMILRAAMRGALSLSDCLKLASWLMIPRLHRVLAAGRQRRQPGRTA